MLIRVPQGQRVLTSLFVALVLFLGQGTAHDAHSETAGTPGGRPDHIIQQARELIDARQYDEAAILLKGVLSGFPYADSVDEAYLLLAQALLHTNQASEARGYLEQLMTEHPSSPLVSRARLLLATAQADLGNLDQAISSLAEAERLTDSLDIKREALKARGELLIAKGEYVLAARAWLDELNLAPQHERPLVRQRIQGLVRDRMDRKALLRVRDAFPTTFPGDVALIRLIELATARGERHQAEQYLSLFLNRFPDHEYAQTAREALTAFKAKLKTSQYVIGVMVPATGRQSAFGEEVLNGVKLALEKGREIRGLTSVDYFVVDTNTEQSLLTQDLSAKIAEYKPIAVIGPLFSRELPQVAELAEKTQTPFLTPTAIFADVRRLSSFLFNTATSPPQQARRLAEYAIRSLGYARFCILYPETAYGIELAHLFAKEVKRLGGEIIAVESYKESDTDFGTQIRRLKAEDLKRHGIVRTVPMRKGSTRLVYQPGFDAVFLPGRSSQIGLLTSQLWFYDVKVSVLGSSTWNAPDLLRALDRSLEGNLFVDGFFAESPNPTIHDFVVKYRLRHQTDPTSIAANAYDATWLVLDALSHGARTGRAVRDHLLESRELPVLSGKAAFEPNGTLDRKVFIIAVKKGRLVQVE
jgi:ABC-type branched-subunit amino acid transport system substrate-binding protein